MLQGVTVFTPSATADPSVSGPVISKGAIGGIIAGVVTLLMVATGVLIYKLKGRSLPPSPQGGATQGMDEPEVESLNYSRSINQVGGRLSKLY
jgi:hypothetical protein